MIGQRLTGRVVKQRMVTIRQIKVLKMFDQKTFLLDMVPPQIKILVSILSFIVSEPEVIVGFGGGHASFTGFAEKPRLQKIWFI